MASTPVILIANTNNNKGKPNYKRYEDRSEYSSKISQYVEKNQCRNESTGKKVCPRLNSSLILLHEIVGV